MSTKVPWNMFVEYFSACAPWYDSVILDVGCLSTAGNDGSQYSVEENTILSEKGCASAPESSDVPTLDSGSSSNKSVTWSDFVVRIDYDGSIEYERMSSETGTAEGSSGVSESKILVELEH